MIGALDPNTFYPGMLIISEHNRTWVPIAHDLTLCTTPTSYPRLIKHLISMPPIYLLSQ